MMTRSKTSVLFLIVVAAITGTARLAAASDLRLVEAVQRREEATARALLTQPIDVRASQPDGTTALHWAAHWNELEIVDLLLRAGADPNAATSYGVTPLSLACSNKTFASVARLLAGGARPNVVLWTGETPLMTCSRTGNADAVRALLTRGADANATEIRRGQSALMWAAAGGHADVIRVLINHGADVNAKTWMLGGFRPAEYVTVGELRKQSEKFDDLGAHPGPLSPVGGFTPLLFAARSGSVESGQILLDAGAHVNDATPSGWTPLLLASASGHQALSVLLVERGADPNARDPFGITALHYAVQEGLSGLSCSYLPSDAAWEHLDMHDLIRALLGHGAAPDARITSGFPHFDYLPYARGCVPPGRYPQVLLGGATPFLLASAAGDPEAMRLLLDGHANPTLATDERVTPLMVAAGVGRRRDRTEPEMRRATDAVRFLLERGADPNAVEAFGRTALHGAANTGADSTIQLLVDRHANLEAKDKYAETPLSIAQADRSGVVAGAVGANRFCFTRTPHPHPSTIELLRRLGAKPVPAARKPKKLPE